MPGDYSYFEGRKSWVVILQGSRGLVIFLVQTIKIGFLFRVWQIQRIQFKDFLSNDADSALLMARGEIRRTASANRG